MFLSKKKVLKLLKNTNVKLPLFDQKNSTRETPLHWAVSCAHMEIVEKLIREMRKVKSKQEQTNASFKIQNPSSKMNFSPRPLAAFGSWRLTNLPLPRIGAARPRRPTFFGSCGLSQTAPPEAAASSSFRITINK